MLIVALVLAVIGLAALVTAVVTNNEIVAWVCIAASALGVVLLVVDAFRERQGKRLKMAGAGAAAETTEVIEFTEDGAPGEETPDTETDGDAEVEEKAGPEADVEADVEIEVETEVEDEAAAEIAAEDHPEEVVHDEPEYDTYSDDEPEYPEAAEEAALHTEDSPEPPAGER